MKTTLKLIPVLAAALTATFALAAEPKDKPTVVLVHGAFADSASWSAIIPKLENKGYHVIAVANPLRSLKTDASYVASVLDSISGPVILVGHSYGGMVISNAAKDKENVKGLVYVAGFAPEEGENAFKLSGQFPGSTLGQALMPPVALAEGSAKDLSIDPVKFRNQFSADVPAKEAKVMAATQRPVTDAALNEGSGAPAWKNIPSWFVYGTLDKNIPAQLHAFMAKRAGSKRTEAVQGASHVVMISHPDAVVKMIEAAANAERPSN